MKLVSNVGKTLVTLSHPTWVRGLKLIINTLLLLIILSHPTWVRGLKLYIKAISVGVAGVAPYMGAWIETYGENPLAELI